MCFSKIGSLIISDQSQSSIKFSWHWVII